MSSPLDHSAPDEVRRVTISSYLGNSIEYYDFLLYGSAAALVFGPLFFAGLNPVAATVASFATLAIGYVARPLGGVVFGVLGDRIGRKRTLLITMSMMGAGSGLIGLLPTYRQVGWIAPALLIALRLIQGISVGGEWGGAALMTAEHAAPHRRGFVTALGQAGVSTGGLLSTAALAAVAALPRDQLLTWGWRVPFLASFALLGVGLYMRWRISESPLFAELELRQQKARRPAVDVVRRQSGAVLRAALASIPPVMSASLFGSFAVAYAVGLGAERSTVLVALSVAWLGAIPLTAAFGRLSDRVGRRPVYLFGVGGMAVLAYPLFLAIGSGSTALLFLGFFVAFAVVGCATTAVLAALLSEMFPTATRYTGMSVAYQGSTIVGGLTPLIASSLLAAAGGGAHAGLVAAFVVLIAAVSAAAVVRTPESRGSSLRNVGTTASAPYVVDTPAATGSSLTDARRAD